MYSTRTERQMNLTNAQLSICQAIAVLGYGSISEGMMEGAPYSAALADILKCEADPDTDPATVEAVRVLIRGFYGIW